ncbi:arginine biosynthesis bifunctional protein ArgJ [Luminiphilus syltensis NOR5-1B]|uniref:Arginine biosynthesis bifunctional protein ArgJ n=1 Tax=Luminiphilus syltensis NOR5-1B TaxID=565045 RepID=B8KR42_9GAMM|nr:arginine biosynthesis bifunctional protein ArgJ [Luminiphilus syltensis NOR5-1B]
MALPIAGIRLGVAQAGIKKPDHDDLTVVELAHGTAVSAVFTQNAFCAAPVRVAKAHLGVGYHRPTHLVINTGNANAGTGEPGMKAAFRTCEAVAQFGGARANAVLPFSTGVIGEPLPVERIEQALPDAFADLSSTGWERASWAILTTDTRPKLTSREVTIDGDTVTITGMAKGAGMLCPNMATMLAFIGTDAAVAKPVLDEALSQAVLASFNRISVDGDTSTNDAAVLCATGKGDVAIGEDDFSAAALFVDALTELCLELAQGLVRDGEGVSKFVAVEVIGGRSQEECDQIGYTIAHSPLVKTALFASDPNWGRLLAAIGRAGLPDLVVEDVAIHINDVLIAEHGARAASYTEEAGAAAMADEDLNIRVTLNRGEASGTIWTSDLSYDYVRINAEYRT